MFTKKFLLDLLERVIATAAQALLGTLTVASVAWGQKWQITGIAALAALLKGLMATRFGAPNTAAMLTVEADTEKGTVDRDWVVIIAIVALVIVIFKLAGVF